MRNGSYATARDALKAMRDAHAAGDPYDFVIADYRMPEMDGASLAKAIKADPALRGAIFIMLTSVGNWRDQAQASQDCVDACLVKPVRHTRLMTTLATSWADTRQAAVRPVQPPPAAAHVSGEFTGRGARVLVVEDNAVNQKVAVMLLARLGIRADVVDGCRERCSKAGMDDFVAKPVQIDALARALRRWLPQPQG